MAVVVNKNGNHYYAHRIVLPDGTVFKFSDTNKNTTQELSRGVTVSGSLADTTSAVSNGNVAQSSSDVNGEKRIRTKKYSLKEYTPEERKQHVKDAVSYFGKTYRWDETGYLTLNGAHLASRRARSFFLLVIARKLCYTVKRVWIRWDGDGKQYLQKFSLRRLRPRGCHQLYH